MVKVVHSLAIMLLSAHAVALDLSASHWSYSKKVDKFTDETTHFATVLSEDSKGYIIFGCYSGKEFEAKVATGSFIGDSAAGYVKYRVDKNEPVQTTMEATEQGMFFNDTGNQFVKDLMNGQSKAVVQLRDYDYETSISTFTLKGSTAAIQKVLGACR